MSVIVGAILVPLSAIAAFALVDPTPTADEVVASDGVTPVAQPVVAATASGKALATDLAAACGGAGIALVDVEQDGTITGVQQAGLDALRQICDREGMPLPGKAASTPTVDTVLVTAGSMSAGPSITPAAEVDDDHDDRDDHDDHDEDDHEDDD